MIKAVQLIADRYFAPFGRVWVTVAGGSPNSQVLELTLSKLTRWQKLYAAMAILGGLVLVNHYTSTHLQYQAYGADHEDPLMLTRFSRGNLQIENQAYSFRQ
ncbi:TPA: hypothetical protein N2B47_005201 [Pseudomonas aeruginosa]|jgi:hypothetical protein|nr:hypothetical protein [Pseudomonas aeruginosa]